MVAPLSSHFDGGIWHRVNGVQSESVKSKEVVSLRRPVLELPVGSESPESFPSPSNVPTQDSPALIPLHMCSLETPTKDFINLALSDDLLACVLSHLPNSKDRAAFTQVCKRWCNLEGVLHLRTRFPGGKLLAEHVGRAMNRFPHLKEVSIDERAVKKGFWRKGNASKGVIDAAMHQLVASCRSLEKLNFYSCTSLTDRTLQFVVGECSSLRSLRLVRCDKVGRSYKKRFKPGSWELEPQSEGHLGSPHFASACTKNLAQLNLFGTGIDDAGVAAIGRYCEGLERLSLAGCHDITDAGLKLLAEGCKRLQDLNIVRCWRITDKGLAAIGEGCGASIKFVSLGFHTEVHDRGLRALATGCSKLELLAISDCNNVTDAGIRTVVRRCKLRILKIGSCLQVKDAAMDFVGRLGTSLETLELRSLIITDRALMNLGSATGCTQLKRILLAGCPYLSDKGLLALTNQETFSLRSVDVRHCREITTSGLAKFMVKCSTLEQMDVDKARTKELDDELHRLRASMA